MQDGEPLHQENMVTFPELCFQTTILRLAEESLIVNEALSNDTMCPILPYAVVALMM